MTMPGDPFNWVNAEFDQDAAKDVIRMAVFAADEEAMKPTPVSKIRNPDGGSQSETPHERTARITETVVMYLLEMGLLVLPEDIGSRLDQYLPVQRMP